MLTPKPLVNLLCTALHDVYLSNGCFQRHRMSGCNTGLSDFKKKKHEFMMHDLSAFLLGGMIVSCLFVPQHLPAPTSHWWWHFLQSQQAPSLTNHKTSLKNGHLINTSWGYKILIDGPDSNLRGLWSAPGACMRLLSGVVYIRQTRTV